MRWLRRRFRFLSLRHCLGCHHQFFETGWRALPIMLRHSKCYQCNSATREVTDDELNNIFILAAGPLEAQDE